jgi:hypothetical protein
MHGIGVGSPEKLAAALAAAQLNDNRRPVALKRAGFHPIVDNPPPEDPPRTIPKESLPRSSPRVTEGLRAAVTGAD